MKMVLTTCPVKDGNKIRENIQKSKLAGCSLRIDLDSKFLQEGKISQEKECLLIFKTRDDLADKIFKKIKESHPYDVPFIGEIEVEEVNREYEKWLNEVTGD